MIDPEATARAFSRLHESGKVRSFGVSNYTPGAFDLLASYVDVPLVSNQIEVSVLQHENFNNGTVAHSQQHRIHPIIWSPLAGGRIFASEEEDAKRVRAALEVVREQIGAAAIDEVAFAWLFSHPAGFIAITGSSELEYIQRPISALAYTLTPEQWFTIWSAATGKKVP
jgi:predicted oxidoreductase